MITNFTAFQKSKTRCEDIEDEFGFTNGDSNGPVAGFVYLDRCYIEIAANEKFHLMIERCDWLESDISKLEEILYFDWVISNEEIATNDIIISSDDLDAAIRGYCEAHAINCDGDLFGVCFSGWSKERGQYMVDNRPATFGDLIEIIHTASDTFKLQKFGFHYGQNKVTYQFERAVANSPSSHAI